MRLAGNKKTDQPKGIKMEGERDKEVAERLALSGRMEATEDESNRDRFKLSKLLTPRLAIFQYL